MRNIFITIITLLSLHSDIFAQLTLEDYKKQVIDNSWTLKGAQNSVTQSEKSVAYTRILLLPQLIASGSYRYYLRQFEGQEPWGVAIEPQIIQTIYGGGVVRSEVKKAELTSREAKFTAEYTVLEVAYLADYAYWNYWAMNRLHLVMEQYVEIIANQNEKIERKYYEGYTSKGDLLMMKSQLSEAQYSLISSYQTKMKALYNLNTLRGVAPSDSVSIAKIDINNYPLPIRVPIEQVVAQRPDYSAMLLKEQIAQVATQSVRGGYNPTLQGGVAGGLRSYIPNVNGDTYLDASIYLSLSIPIYRFGERKKAVSVSKSSERQASFNSSILLEDIIQNESDAWLAVVEGMEQVDVATKSVEIASENLEISTYSYNEGLVSILDLMQAQLSWMQIYTNAINAEYNYLLALAYYKKIAAITE